MNLRRSQEIWGLLLLWLGVHRLIGAPYGIQQYSSYSWQSDDGLPANSVGAIAQTDDGYLWIGTRCGLVRFDGVSFQPLQEASASPLRNTRINALCAGKDDCLWIGYSNGVMRLKNGVFVPIRDVNGTPLGEVKCLFQDSRGAMWIGTDHGLIRCSNGAFTSYTGQNGLADDVILSVCEDRHGTLWIATLHGLSSLDLQGRIKSMRLSETLSGNALRCVSVDREGNLWIAANSGLYRMDEKQGRRFYGIEEGLPNRPVNLAYEDREGQIWIGTVGGLACMEEGRPTYNSDREGVFGDMINAMCQDREGNLWIGAKDGLYRLNPRRFTIYGPRQGLRYENIMSVCGDASGGIWIASWGGGLNRLKDEIITHFARPTGIGHDLALALAEERDGSIWVGMDFDSGLFRFKDGQFNAYSKREGLIPAGIRVLHQDQQGALWIGTGRGLNILRDGKMETLTTADGLTGNTILAICEDRHTNIWIGTDGGLTRWNAGGLARFTTRNGLSDNYVNALYEDAEGVLWIGTRQGGLNRWKGGRFTACTVEQGLFSNEIFEIIEDDFGLLWMTCGNGIFNVSKRQLNDLAEGRAATVISHRYGKADGLVSVQCSGIAKPGGWKGKDGRLWFPTFRGLVAVNSRIQPNNKLAPVVLEEIIADRRVVRQNGVAAAAASALRIPPGRGELEFHYAILSYQAPEKNRFRYRLENVDLDWVDAGSRRVAYYNHLHPGKYRFSVVACNNDGLWNEQGAGIDVVLLPHFWQRWWFIGLIGMAGVCAIAVSVRRYEKRKARREFERLEQQHLIERERARIAKDIHDDLGASLTRMTFLSELVKTDETREEVESHAGKIAAAARETVSALDEIVWAVNPQSDTLDSLLQYLSHYATKFFEETSISCRLEIPIDIPHAPVTAEVRHNVFLVVKEALNNVLKHSGATEARVRVALFDCAVQIEVADNGRGLAPAGDGASRKRSGLGNMRQRLESIGGFLQVESRPGQGTRVIVRAPLQPNLADL